MVKIRNKKREIRNKEEGAIGKQQHAIKAE
jgi:hypothetical protein